MYKSTITVKGQTTIPLGIRKQLSLNTGDNIEYYNNSDGTITITNANLDITQLAGIMRKPDKVISIEEMNRVITERRGKSDRG